MENKNKNFHWDESTISHFRFESNYISRKETKENITLFVENECSLEDGECEIDLILDLFKIVYNTKKHLFVTWLNSDNVIKVNSNHYRCQCIQYKKAFTLKQIYIYWNSEYFIHM